jgi:hypothetical protein
MVVASVIFIIDIYIVLNERVCSLLGTLVHFTYSRVELSISLRSMRANFFSNLSHRYAPAVDACHPCFALLYAAFPMRAD